MGFLSRFLSVRVPLFAKCAVEEAMYKLEQRMLSVPVRGW